MNARGFVTTLAGNLLGRRAPGGAESASPQEKGPGASASTRRNFFLHLHAVRIRPIALRPSTTFGLGTALLALFGLLSVSGLALMIYYVPTTEGAYGSMQDIQSVVVFGGWVRSLHRLAANAMVLVLALHLVRVAATASYRGRQRNWFIGLALGMLTLALCFTGYLLPWDQRSYWAVTVVTGTLDHLPGLGPWLKQILLGGERIGGAALLRFYVLHVALLPALGSALIGWHLWRIRKDGGLAIQGEGPEFEPVVPVWPHGVLRELNLILLVSLVIFAIAAAFPPTLGLPVDPQVPSNPEKAPWYLVWLQEMVSYSVAVGVWGFPATLLAGLLLLPRLDRESAGTGRFLGTRGIRWACGLSTSLAMLIFCLVAAWYLGAGRGSDPAQGALLFSPASAMLLLALLSFLVAGWSTGSVRVALLAGLCVLAVALVGCLILGACRGPGWVFFWPWEGWPGGN